LTASQYSISTPNHDSNTLSFGQQQQQQPSGSTTRTHHSQVIIPQSVPAASSRSSKLLTNDNSSSPLMTSHRNSTKDQSLYMNSDPTRSSKGLPSLAPLFDPMQQHIYRLPSSHSVKMHNMNPLIRPPLDLQQAPTRFSPMINNSNGLLSQHRDADHYSRMGPYHHPEPYPRTHYTSFPMYLNDGWSSSSQAINNILVPATMSTQQLNIQNLGPIGPPGELQASAIHNYASTRDVPNSQQQQQIPSNSSQFFPLLDYFKAPPSNLNVDDEQPSSPQDDL
jgi:hypothetical protein